MTSVAAPLPTAWRELTARVNGETLFGVAGVRDPDYPCDAFDPVADIDWLGVRITAPGNGQCDADGHYLCRGCRELSQAQIDHWREVHR